MSEPRTTDYCARCGHSPEAGCHLFAQCEYFYPGEYRGFKVDCQVKVLRPTKIYAAGPSASPDEADMFCRMLAEAGWEVTSTWPGQVTSHGGGNPPDSTQDQRFQWSEEDRVQLEAADVLWARTPPPGVVTHGTFWEMGYARGRGKHVVVSGPDHHRSIFTAQADVIFPTHMEAVAYLSRILRSGLTATP